MSRYPWKTPGFDSNALIEAAKKKREEAEKKKKEADRLHRWKAAADSRQPTR